MKYIHYDGSAIMTGDAIADAVIEYAAVLGANGMTDTVHVPTFDEHGSVMRATLLIGPASQIVVDGAPDDELEPDDPEFVGSLQAAARRIAQDHPVHAEGGPDFGGSRGGATAQQR